MIRYFFIICIVLLNACHSINPYFDSQKKHHTVDGFKNIDDAANKTPSTKKVFTWLFSRNKAKSQQQTEFHTISTNTLKLNNSSEVQLTWLGHSSILLQIKGFNILFDPVFSQRVSPFRFIGPKRQVPLPIRIESLPSIDYIIISHDHYDHLDIKSIKKIAALNPHLQILSPLAYRALFKKHEIANPVYELDWWEHIANDQLSFYLTPAQHWCKRGLLDKNERLWGSWFIQSENFNFYFAGDSGYSNHFKTIQQKLGSVDMAALPIGAYQPQWLMAQHHMSPKQALQAHIDLKSKRSVAIHWGTYILSDEALHQPKDDLIEASLAYKTLSPFMTLAVGESYKLEL
ncbi:MBL fold metallo-hydrolase [bacterium]|nr:MBL fold metallo-hydrolase [bacterium]